MLADLFGRIRRGWEWAIGLLHLRGHYSTLLYSTADVNELPELVADRTVYVVGENGYLWYAAMLCPCGCRAVIHLSLMPDGHPRWALKRHPKQRVSLTPSVWRKAGCRSHFFLRDGRILWCGDSAHTPISDRFLSRRPERRVRLGIASVIEAHHLLTLEVSNQSQL